MAVTRLFTDKELGEVISTFAPLFKVRLTSCGNIVLEPVKGNWYYSIHYVNDEYFNKYHPRYHYRLYREENGYNHPESICGKDTFKESVEYLKRYLIKKGYAL